jgi:branched-chain amino acid transport system permease protein
MTEALQYIFNGVAAGSTYALIGIGFMFIYSTCRFFHFAHGAVYTIGAYATYGALKLLSWPPAFAILCGLCVATLAGSLMEVGLYRPLRKARASGLILLLASLSVYVVLQTLTSVLFGPQTVNLRGSNVSVGLDILGARITAIQVIIFFTSIILCSFIWAGMYLTRLGRMLRATANDPELAIILGIPIERIFLLTFAVGSLMAGVAGVLIAYDTNLTPTMGLSALLMGMVASIIGGNGSVPGVWIGGLFIGLAHQFGGVVLPSQWQDAIVFGILLIALILRPQGILGSPLRKVTV